MNEPTSIALPPGTFRRSVFAETHDTTVRAQVEDNYHHFEILMETEKGRVSALKPRAIRTPWSLCPQAASQLDELIGMKIGTNVYRRSGMPDPRQHCTHLYELALFAMAQAARGGHRRYDIAVPDREGRVNLPFMSADGRILTRGPVVDGHTFAELRLNGKKMLEWEIVDESVVAPARFAGQNLRSLPAWAAAVFDDDTLEAIKQLRRGVHISGGRIVPLDIITRAEQHPPQMGGCYVFQTHRVQAARRNVGSTFEVNENSELLKPGAT